MNLPGFLAPVSRYFSAIGNASAYAKWLLDREGDNSSGVAVDVPRAMQLSYVAACIKVLSETLAHVPLQLMRRTPGGGARPAVNHRQYGLLSMVPNDDQSPFVFKQAIEAQRQGWGNGYAEIIYDGPFPLELRLLFADQVQPEYLQDGTLIYRVTGDHRGPGRDRKTRTLMASDILHVPGMGFNGVQGYSPIRMAREAIGLGLAIHIHGGKFFRRGGSPKGVVTTDMNMRSVVEFARVWQEQVGSDVGDSGQTPILPKGVGWHPTMINPDDAQTLETLKLNRSEICGIWRVPPVFVQDLEHNTFTNAAEQDTHFVKHTMMPIFTAWEQECTRKLLSKGERARGLFYKHDTDAILKANITLRYGAYHVALQDGWLLRSEVREMEGLPMVEGMDTPLTPSNMMKGTGDANTGMQNRPEPPPALPNPDDDEEDEEDD